MNLEKRLEAFSVLGSILRSSLEDTRSPYGSEMKFIIEKQQYQNKWFTPGNVRTAVWSIAQILTKENLRQWTDNYQSLKEEYNPGKTGVIFAGNIPGVGFHDYLSVLISGNNVIAKTSSKDPDLVPFLHKILCDAYPEFATKAEFTTGKLSGFHSIIATGSNNTSRYFEYYFGKYPHIIRKNRSSIAILDGSESDNDLELLGRDIFTYFGLGCRNVSKIYVPEGYDITQLKNKWDIFSDCINHSGYGNNYDYNKAIFLVNRIDFHDAGFVLLRKESSLSSPVAVLNYEFYNNPDDVYRTIDLLRENIQCVVGKGNIPFGKSQIHDLWDYADGVDTLDFLLKKNFAGIL